MREIVIDTETTGLSPEKGDRIIEIAGVELINKIPTGVYFQSFVNPQTEISETAFKIHLISNDFLKNKPLFKDIAPRFIDFIEDSPLVIHNAEFDIGFMQNELKLAGFKLINNPVIDTLKIAQEKFKGLSSSLDNLCKRFNIDLSEREPHSALIDAKLLAKVYLELCNF